MERALKQIDSQIVFKLVERTMVQSGVTAVRVDNHPGRGLARRQGVVQSEVLPQHSKAPVGLLSSNEGGLTGALCNNVLRSQ